MRNQKHLSTNLGVPQGSVLGPLLFCLYINNVQLLFTHNGVEHILYADDLQIYVQVPSSEFEEGIARLSNTAKEVSEWAVRSGLMLNPNKTQAIFFALRHTASKLDKKGLSGVQLGSGITILFPKLS